MACKRCQKKVSDDEIVVCRGYCGASFHAVCVNVDEPLRKQLKHYRNNVFWMCDGCANLFTNAHFRTMMTGFDDKISAMPAAIETMKGEIEKLHNCLNNLSAKVDGMPSTPTPFSTPNPWPAIHRINRSVKSAKRLRDIDGNSIKVDSGSIKTGTKALDALSSVRLAPRSNDDLFWIYLSAFHRDTSECQITSFVTECLELPTNIEPQVVKLVPKGKDPNTLNFVSFKVGLSDKFRDKALSCDSWPENIRFRQFEDNRSKNLPHVVSLTSTIHPGTEDPSERASSSMIV